MRALDFFFAQFVVGNAVHQQATTTVTLFMNGYLMAGAVKLLCTGQTSRSATDNRNFFAASSKRRLGNDPALFESLVNDGDFMQLDADSRFDNAQNTRCFARCRTDTTGKLREVIGCL